MHQNYQGCVDRKRDRSWSAKGGGNNKKSAKNSSNSSSSSIDDELGHFHAAKGNLITNRYEVKKELGKGTFGKVFGCKDLKHNDSVAIKVVRSIKRYVSSAKIESDILHDIYTKQKANNVDICVKMFSRFHFDGYYCLVFETLGISLYDLIKMNSYKRLPLDCVRDITRQMLEGMDFLRSINLIHTDLKLENVLFVHRTLETVNVDHRGKRYDVFVPVNRRIKLIDFGGATYNSEQSMSSIVNTRQYRGPEVTLELGWSFPSDLWSVGCLVAEIYCGDLLFETHDELEHLALMERILGYFPLFMSQDSPHREKYFHRDGRVRIDDLKRESRDHVRDAPELRDFFTVSPGDERSGIVELVRALLVLDPRRRATAREALQYDFVTNNKGN